MSCGLHNFSGKISGFYHLCTAFSRSSRPPESTLSTRCDSRMGQRMGQNCDLDMDQPVQLISLPFPGCCHIQDHCGFRFSDFALTSFEGGFSLPVFEPPTEQRYSFPLPVISHSNFNMGQQYGSGRSATQEQTLIPLQGVVIVA